MCILTEEYLKSKGFIETESGVYEKQLDRCIIKVIKDGAIFIPSVLNKQRDIIEHDIKIDNTQDFDEYLSYVENKYKP